MKDLRQQLRSLFENPYGEHCPLHFPWSVDRYGQSYIHAMRREALAYEWTLARTFIGRAKLVVAALLWPGISTVEAARLTYRFGSLVKNQCGVGVLRQFYEQMYLANVLNLPGDIYYRYRLFNKRDRSDFSYYLSGYAFRLLLKKINRHHKLGVIGDKEMFFINCQRYHLPTVPVIAVFRDGKLALPSQELDQFVSERNSGTSLQLPSQSLFFKPTGEMGGRGAERWQYDSKLAAWQRGEKQLVEHQLINRFCERSHSQTYLLQPCIASHSKLQQLSPETLPTVRVVTTRAIGEQPMVVRAALRMSSLEGREVDNFSQGGIASAIDVDSGELSYAVAKDFTRGLFSKHPMTDEQIKGLVQPHWPSIQRTVIQAHEKFSEFVSVGWDVAVTEEGPLLLEANIDWGHDLLQIPHDRPLGITDFPRCLLKEFQAAA